jgi:hypothetical protein
MHGSEEVARMTYLSRYCAGCDEDRLFGQFHDEPASCPDVLDGDCPEWACSVCGDALIIGLPVSAAAIRAAVDSAAVNSADVTPAGGSATRAA